MFRRMKMTRHTFLALALVGSILTLTVPATATALTVDILAASQYSYG